MHGAIHLPYAMVTRRRPMPSPEALQYAKMLRSAPKMVEMTLSDQRAAGERAEALTTEPCDIIYRSLEQGEKRGLWAMPKVDAAHCAVLYFFGGGHIISSVNSRRKFAGHLANAAGCRVFIADYRLAPEHPFPADVEDATAAYRWLLELGHESTHVAIGGESSSGGLTMSTLLALRRLGIPLPTGAFLLSPWIDLTCGGETHQTKREVDLTVTTAGLRRMAKRYLGDHDPHDPLVAPLEADLSGLPPLFIQVGGDEILLDDAVQLARRAGMAGTMATLEIWPGMQHFFQIAVGLFPEAGAAVARLGAWLRERLPVPAERG
jgi:acetyl esterase/lipase